MISYLKGAIRSIDKEDSHIVVVAGGVGYTILLPYFVMRTFVDHHKQPGDEVELEIYYHISEKQPRPVLVGFNNEFERRFFEKLIGVETLGPAKAAKAFVFSVSTVAGAIEDGNPQALERMPGIGSRLAQKIIATLQGKVAEFALLKDEGYSNVPSVTPEDTKTDIKEEALEVLTRLGEKRGEAKIKVEEALQRNPGVRDTEELLREVLKKERA
jgi:Holliday junction DNA helicase RuvA